MLARTYRTIRRPHHPGKRICSLYCPLKKVCDQITAHSFEAKLTGAVGNFNALQAAAPQVDWFELAKNLLLGLT